MKYCSQCGHSVSFRIPDQDDRPRHVCDQCSFIHYENPRIVVCSLPCFEDRVLLCKRAIEPCYGLWTLPGGFMENGETTMDAAARETREEACAQIRVGNIYTLFNLPHINQVHLFYLAELTEPAFAAGAESLEVHLLGRKDIPWDSIAFPAVGRTLEHYFNDLASNHFPMRVADVVVNEHNERLIRPHH